MPTITIGGTSRTVTDAQMRAIENTLGTSASSNIPANGSQYFHVTSSGLVAKRTWTGDAVDRARLAFGNAYTSKQDAKDARDSAKVEAKLDAVALSLGAYTSNGSGDGYAPLWDDGEWVSGSDVNANDYTFESEGSCDEFISRCSAELTARFGD